VRALGYVSPPIRSLSSHSLEHLRHPRIDLGEYGWKRSLVCEPIARMIRPTQKACRLIQSHWGCGSREAFHFSMVNHCISGSRVPCNQVLLHNPEQLGCGKSPFSPNAVIRAMHPLPRFGKRKSPRAGTPDPSCYDSGEAPRRVTARQNKF